MTLPFCSTGAKRVTLDKIIKLRDGERVPMIEAIPDEDAPQPDGRMLRREREEAVRRALRQLLPEERKAFHWIVMRGKTQEWVAKRMGLSRDQIRLLLENAQQRLRTLLAAYKDEYNRLRLPNE